VGVTHSLTGEGTDTVLFQYTVYVLCGPI
jgi:hypothetical protein